jgi:hypothetical protein
MMAPQRLDLNSIVQRDSEVISAESDRDLVMVSIANGAYYGVSDAARDIWEAIEQPKKILDVVDDLCATYNVDRASCEQKTFSFIEELMAENLLRVVNVSDVSAHGTD